MKLLLDTSHQQKIKIKLGEKSLSKSAVNGASQQWLFLLDKLLSQNRFSIKRIKEIEVNRGPGSFTGLRVGVSAANALGWALKIPVNKKKQIVLPQYE